MLNPFRYRGYYYDVESGLYYLQSRYYDPAVGRFISQDSIKYIAPQTLNGINLYAYCLDNPVMGYDPEGTDAIYVTLYDLNNNGLPVVGHAVLLIEDADGNWWLSEYSGRDFNKYDTYVNFYKLGDNGYADVEKYISDHQPKDWWQAIKSRFGFCGISYVRLEGDYTNSLNLANYYKDNGFGDYHLLTHNCLHYVKTLLKEGTNKSLLLQTYIDNSLVIVPSGYFLDLRVFILVSKFLQLIKELNSLRII